ncbi:MAG TPA: copper amine oxidase N-terminal domain-containing protein [Caldisericia bacterium]|nr:copper amine oxidase N-terminal domain-containing protein [Caldisericia bacterium]
MVLKLQIGNKTMWVNDNEIEIDVPPQIVEGRTLLPIRWVAEPLGAEVGWDGDEKKVTVTLKDTTIELWIGKSIAKVNGVNTPIDPTNPKVVPMIISGRTMLPVRFVAENLGCKVDWDQDTKTVTITYPKD